MVSLPVPVPWPAVATPPTALRPLALVAPAAPAWPVAPVAPADPSSPASGVPGQHVPVLARLLGDIVQMQPQPNALPGGNVLQSLMNGLEFWALALALVGLVIGAAAWALGSHGQNYHQSYVGRRAVLISGLAALLIGAGPGIVSFFFNTGQGVHSP